MIDKNIINFLPSTIGVYFFKKKETILYIGKSINIKARVKSHIENAKLDRKEFLIVNNSDSVESIVVDNEFNALILESELIKKYQPKYNVIWKDGKSYLYIKITIKDEFPKILLSRKPNFKNIDSLYFGPFSSTRTVRSLISDIRKIVPFCTEKNLTKKPCFYSKIGLCHPCPSFINNQKDGYRNALKKTYQKNIKRVIKIFQGKVSEILNDFYKQLKKLIKEKKYEEAIVIRDKIKRIERLINYPTTEIDIQSKKEDNLQAFLKIMKNYFPILQNLDRVECYDISNLGESHQVGSMVVLTKGLIDKKEYRRFSIKTTLKSDFERLNQIIERRFNNHWPLPDLIIIDGGKPQVKVILNLLKKLKKNIPVLGIAKNPDRLIIGVEGLPTLRFSQTNSAFNLIRMIRDESHRFANKYHRYLRKSDFLV